jgi:hypothetical protein
MYQMQRIGRFSGWAQTWISSDVIHKGSLAYNIKAFLLNVIYVQQAKNLTSNLSPKYETIMKLTVRDPNFDYLLKT